MPMAVATGAACIVRAGGVVDAAALARCGLRTNVSPSCKPVRRRLGTARSCSR
jgi:hypothetical protein